MWITITKRCVAIYCKFSECQASYTNVRPPYWKLSGDGLGPRAGEPIYYHGPHEFCIIGGGP